MDNELDKGQNPKEALNPEDSEELGNEGLENEPNNSEVVEDELGGDSNLDEDIDFTAELEKERARLGQKIDKERKRRIEAENQIGISREEVEQIVDERTAITEKRLIRERASIIAERLSKTIAERDLTLFHYDNSVILTGNVEEDIEKAHAIANRKKVKGEISELKKANQSKQNIRFESSGAGAPTEIKKAPKYSQEDIDGAKFAGVTPEEFVKRKNK